MYKKLNEINEWFSGERALPQENRSLTEQAVACYLSAKPVKRWLFPDYDPICNEGRRLLDEGIAAGEIDALYVSVFIDMGLWMRAKYDWELLPVHMQALYEKTGDEEVKEILDNFPECLEVLKKDREHEEFVAGIKALKDQGLPPDLGAHDPAYYEDNE